MRQTEDPVETANNSSCYVHTPTSGHRSNNKNKKARKGKEKNNIYNYWTYKTLQYVVSPMLLTA